VFDTVFGLPLHALVIHAVVVLLPVAAIGGVLVAVLPRFRTRFGILVAAAAVVTVPTVIVAAQSGEQLERRVDATLGPGAASAREAQLMEAHTGIADNLLPWTIVLALALVVLMAIVHYRRRTGSPSWLRPAGYVTSAVTIVGAVLSLYWVIRIGDAGSRAAWTDVVDAGG